MWTETVTKKLYFDLQQKVPLDFFGEGAVPHDIQDLSSPTRN